MTSRSFEAITNSDWVRASATGTPSRKANVRSPGQFTFNGSLTGLGLADFMVGQLFQYIQAVPNTLDMEQLYLGLYAQDTWQASPRATLNYGVRWEPGFAQQIRNGAIYNFDVDRFLRNERSTILELARRTGDYAMAGIVARATIAGQSLADPRLVPFGVGEVPILAHGAMAALAGKPADAATIAAAQAALAQELEPPADLNGGADMKRHLAQVLLARAVQRLIAGGEVRGQ